VGQISVTTVGQFSIAITILDGRNTLTWNDGTTKVLDKDISAINFKKLNDLANTEGCSVNAVVSKLLKAYKQGKG